MKRFDARAPTTRAEALALSTRAQRWHAPTQRTDGTQFNEASRVSLEAMLVAHGWEQRPHPRDGGECWWHTDQGATMSTFVRAVRLTLDALAGRDVVAGIAPIPAAKVGAS